MTDMLPSVVL